MPISVVIVIRFKKTVADYAKLQLELQTGKYLLISIINNIY